MRRSWILLSIMAAGCSDAEPLADGGPPDASVVITDAAPADATPSPVDASAPDATPMDAAAPDASVPDSGPMDSGQPDTGVEPRDAGEIPDSGTPPDAGTLPDAGTCNYIDLEVCIVECNSYEYARRFVDTLGACPDFFRLNGNDYPDIAAAISGEGCNSTCIYKAFQSVSFIDHCNRRNGYIVFTAPDRSCPDLYEFSNGLFLSVSDWEAVTPCPG